MACIICKKEYTQKDVDAIVSKLKQETNEIRFNRQKWIEANQVLTQSNKELQATIAGFEKSSKELKAQNDDLRAKCAKIHVQYVKQPITIECPYCDYQEMIESTGDEPINVAEVLSEHLSTMHVPPELIKIEVYPECGSCFLNFANVEKIRAYQIEKDAEIQNLRITIPLEYLEDEGELVVVECFIEGEYKILKIPRKYLNENPVSVEDGLYYVYKDGSKYYRYLIQDIKKHYRACSKPTATRTAKNPSLAIETKTKESKRQPLATDVINSDTSSMTVDNTTPEKNISIVRDDPKEIGSPVIKMDESADNNPTQESPSLTAKDIKESNVKPHDETSNCLSPEISDKQLSTNEQKILDFLLAHPSSANKTIANGLGMDRSNVSKYIRKLEARTLVYVQNGVINVVH